MSAPIYRRTYTRFISSSDHADYGVTLVGTSEETRVAIERDGTVHMKYVHGRTASEERDYIAAVLAYKADEYERYVQWAKERGYEIEPEQVLTPRYRVVEATPDA